MLRKREGPSPILMEAPSTVFLISCSLEPIVGESLQQEHPWGTSQLHSNEILKVGYVGKARDIWDSVLEVQQHGSDISLVVRWALFTVIYHGKDRGETMHGSQ